MKVTDVHVQKLLVYMLLTVLYIPQTVKGIVLSAPAFPPENLFH